VTANDIVALTRAVFSHSSNFPPVTKTILWAVHIVVDLTDYLLCNLSTRLSSFLTLQVLTLKMEAANPFAISVTVYTTTRYHNPEDHNLNIDCRVNLKNYITAI
jgi:hypothetical protein